MAVLLLRDFWKFSFRVDSDGLNPLVKEQLRPVRIRPFPTLDLAGVIATQVAERSACSSAAGEPVYGSETPVDPGEKMVESDHAPCIPPKTTSAEADSWLPASVSVSTWVEADSDFGLTTAL